MSKVEMAALADRCLQNSSVLDSVGYEHRCEMIEVLQLAYAIDRDGRANWLWYREDAIASLGGRTAHALVHEGRGHEVLQFLLRIVVEERGLAVR